MFTLLMLLTALAVVALVVVLAYYLIKISALLESIGGTPTSSLATYSPSTLLHTAALAVRWPWRSHFTFCK